MSNPTDPAGMQPNAEKVHELTPAELPLSCPMPGMNIWNSHPRVWLPIEKTGQVKCPYCGTSYRLVR